MAFLVTLLHFKVFDGVDIVHLTLLINIINLKSDMREAKATREGQGVLLP